MDPHVPALLSPADVDRIATECASAAGSSLLEFVGDDALLVALAQDLIVDALGQSPPRAREITAHVTALTRAARERGVDVDEFLVRVARYAATIERAVARLHRASDYRPFHARWVDAEELISRAAIFAYYGDTFPSPEQFDAALRALIVERSRVRTIVQAESRKLDRGSGAVIATDIAGTILYWNEAATSLYGWRIDEVLGRSIVEVTPATHTREQAAEIMQQLARGESWTGSFAVRDRNGVAMLVDVVDVPVQDNGAIVGVVGISTPTIAR